MSLQKRMTLDVNPYDQVTSMSSNDTEKGGYDLLPNNKDGDKEEFQWVTTEEIAEKGFLPALEGLRGVAVMGPFVDHAFNVQPFRHLVGSMGVTIFFVLSGFLITGNLLRCQSKNPPKRPSQCFRHLPRFWIDRIVRLQPALVVCVSTGTLILWLRHGEEHLRKILHASVRALCSLMNTRYFIYGGESEAGEWAFPHTWSLACEEQFYMLWCLVLAIAVPLAGHSRGLIFLCLSLLALSYFVRIADGLHNSNNWLFYWQRGPISQFWKMLLGSAIRLIGFPRAWCKLNLSRVGLLLLALLPIAAYACPNDVYTLASLLFDTLAAISSALIIIGSIQSSNRFLEWHLTRFLGKISYAAYLWSAMLIGAFDLFGAGWPAVTNTCTGILCAIASTFWIEIPLRRWYHRRS